MEFIEPQQLYDEKGEVSASRPIFQGDVFRDVFLPGFGEEPRLVQIVAHPCSMRAGTQFHPRITVAPIEKYQRVADGQWDGHLRVMPLAELVNGDDYGAKLVDVTAAPAGCLPLDARIATLSDRGIYVLQQRLVKHYTRLEVEIPVLAKESAPLLWEMHTQRDWIETVLENETDWTITNLGIEESAFDSWLREGNPDRRTTLKLDHTHADLRREAHTAALSRRAQLTSGDV